MEGLPDPSASMACQSFTKPPGLVAEGFGVLVAFVVSGVTFFTFFVDLDKK
jgi:hypothetical protein